MIPKSALGRTIALIVVVTSVGALLSGVALSSQTRCNNCCLSYTNCSFVIVGPTGWPSGCTNPACGGTCSVCTGAITGGAQYICVRQVNQVCYYTQGNITACPRSTGTCTPGGGGTCNCAGPYTPAATNCGLQKCTPHGGGGC